MKHKHRTFIISVALVIITVALSGVAKASWGYEGTAAYRDGVTPIIDACHGAIVSQEMGSSSNITLCRFANVPGPTVGPSASTNYSGFMGGNNTYLGNYAVYVPNRDDVITYAVSLMGRSYVIPSFLSLLETYYPESHYSGKTYHSSSDIAKVRCDGLVEWAYEYGGYKVMQINSSVWDISTVAALRYHNSLNNMWPSTQKNVMTRLP